MTNFFSSAYAFCVKGNNCYGLEQINEKNVLPSRDKKTFLFKNTGKEK